MTEIDHSARRDELAPYLLGALELGEMADLEQHLAGCEECREELERLRPAVLALPDSVERHEAPRQIRDRVMAEVRADGRKSREERGFAWPSIPLRPALGFAAVLMIAIAVVGYAIGEGGSSDRTSTVVAGKSPGVTVKMVRDGDSGTVALANVRRLPPDRLLQAWVKRGERVEPAGQPFPRNPDGTASVAIDDMRGVSVVMVTAEPRGGVTQPTAAPLVSLSVPQ